MNDNVTIGASSLKLKTIAIVSGKGGSGKTMIAAMLTRILDLSTEDVLLVDSDTATAGLTYYLGLKYVSNTAIGLANMLKDDASPADGYEVFDRLQNRQHLKEWRSARFLGVGDHRRLYREVPELELPLRMEKVLSKIAFQSSSFVVVDCRGGIDQESLAVCKSADGIVLVVETDIASFQASQYLVDILSSSGLGDKLLGFIINKAFDDPSVIARNGTAIFRCRYLGSIPFDFVATRAFLVGSVPPPDSLFGVHVWQAAYNLLPSFVEIPTGRVWSLAEFHAVGISDVDSQRGGLVSAAMIALTFALWLMIQFLPGFGGIRNEIVVAYLACFGFVGSIEPGRRVIGRLINIYTRRFRRRDSTLGF